MSSSRIPLYHRITDGIRITARPAYLAEQSQGGNFVFTYHIRIENIGTQAAQLLSRRWLIHDDVTGDGVVEGDGVVGQQPRIAPGMAHEYSSFCVLKGPSGWMEGSYFLVRDDGSEIEALIPRFMLSADDPAA
jgi:ApaG protein